MSSQFVNRNTVLSALAGCTVLTAVVCFVRICSFNSRTQGTIATADNRAMALLGVTHFRAQLHWSSQHSSRTAAMVLTLLKRRFLKTRTESRVFSSGDKVLETKLEIRFGKLHTAELVATPECVSAAHEWAKMVKTNFPNARIVINGKQAADY